VWIYGERGRFWPEAKELIQWRGKEVYEPWAKVLSGSDVALSFARDPQWAALNYLAANPNALNLARNADFSSERIAPTENAASDWKGDGPVASWLTWQGDESNGTFSWDKTIGASAPGSARLSGISTGCFIQPHKVQAGQNFIIAARVKQSGRGYSQITARWKDQNGAWTALTSDIALFVTGAADATGWRTVAGSVVVPPSATQLIVLLNANGQRNSTDQIWFDDVQVVALPSDKS
jgi:hypothetical protein